MQRDRIGKVFVRVAGFSVICTAVDGYGIVIVLFGRIDIEQSYFGVEADIYTVFERYAATERQTGVGALYFVVFAAAYVFVIAAVLILYIQAAAIYRRPLTA